MEFVFLRWNPPSDNGSRISQYVLESSDVVVDCGRNAAGNAGNFVEIFKGRAKSFTATKLQVATSYRSEEVFLFYSHCRLKCYFVSSVGSA